MVPTDIVETKVTSHTRRDIAGLFTSRSTALSQNPRRRPGIPDSAVMEHARKIIVTTVLAWFDIPPGNRNQQPKARML